MDCYCVGGTYAWERNRRPKPVMVLDNQVMLAGWILTDRSKDGRVVIWLSDILLHS